MYLSFSLIEERALDLRLTHICLGLIGISEKNNRFGRDIDTFRIEFAVLHDIQWRCLLTVEKMGLELDQGIRCRSRL